MTTIGQLDAEKALALARRSSDGLGTYSALYFLAQIALARGDYATATGMLKEGVALAAQVGPRGGLAYLLEGLAAVAHAQGKRSTQHAYSARPKGWSNQSKHPSTNATDRNALSGRSITPRLPRVPGWARGPSRRRGPRDER